MLIRLIEFRKFVTQYKLIIEKYQTPNFQNCKVENDQLLISAFYFRLLQYKPFLEIQMSHVKKVIFIFARILKSFISSDDHFALFVSIGWFGLVLFERNM